MYLYILLLFAALLPAESPESIRPAGSLRLVAVVHDPKALGRAHDVELQGNIAFVAGKTGSIAFIDISKPSKPRLLSVLADSKEFEDAETVLPHGDVLYAGTRDFLAIDIRDPAQPKVLKKISDRPRIDNINGMAMWRNYVFSANKSGYVSVFDVSKPKEPALHDMLDTKADGLSAPHAIETLKDHIIVANTGRSETVHVRLYRITDPDTGELLPSTRWKREGFAPSKHDLSLDWALHGANRVAVWDRYAAIGAYVPDRIGIFEIPAPGKLAQIAHLPTCDIDATGMAISGDMLFVSGGECVEAIDVSDPVNPVSVAQYRGGNLFPTRAKKSPEGRNRYDNGHDLVYRDGYLYITAQNDDRLGIIQVMDPRILKKAVPRQGGRGSSR
jgi:hypothetical protein